MKINILLSVLLNLRQICSMSNIWIISASFFVFFSVRLLSVLRGHSVFSPPPQQPMTSDFEGFSIPDVIHYIYFSYLNSWERASIFPFECSVLNKGTTGTIFITSLIWRGPWLGIEPETSRTRSQHSTTRLSRRRSSLDILCGTVGIVSDLSSLSHHHGFEPHQTPAVVSLNKKLYPHCLVLVDSRNRFYFDFSNKLK